MESDRIAEFANIRILKFRHGAAPEVVVVVQNPDLGRGIRFLKQGPQMVLHETHLVFLRPRTGWHSTILIGINFVLYRHRLDCHPFPGICLKELQKIL